jgi:hypothetical protein
VNPLFVAAVGSKLVILTIFAEAGILRNPFSSACRAFAILCHLFQRFCQFAAYCIFQLRPSIADFFLLVYSRGRMIPLEKMRCPEP